MWPDRPSELNEPHWNWQFRNNPNNPTADPEIWIFKDNGRISGHQGTIPILLKIGDAYYRSSWAVDLMVDPDFRNKGIGYFLTREFTRSTEVSLVLGLSDDAYPMYKRYGWVDMGGVSRFVKILNAKHLARNRISVPVVSNLISALMNIYLKIRDAQLTKRAYENHAEIDQVDYFDEQFDEFWERVSESFPLIARRDSRYLNWKYLSQPGMNYTVFRMRQEEETAGYVVLRIRHEDNRVVGYIVDFLSMPEHLAPLVAKAVDYFRKEGAATIVCCVLNNRIEALMEEFGFHRRGDKTRFMMKANDPELDQEALRMKDEWFVTSGDGDMDRPWDK